MRDNFLKDFISGNDASKILGVSPQTVIGMARRKQLRFVRVASNKMRLYFKPDVLRLAADLAEAEMSASMPPKLRRGTRQ